MRDCQVTTAQAEKLFCNRDRPDRGWSIAARPAPGPPPGRTSTHKPALSGHQRRRRAPRQAAASAQARATPARWRPLAKRSGRSIINTGTKGATATSPKTQQTPAGGKGGPFRRDRPDWPYTIDGLHCDQHQAQSEATAWLLVPATSHHPARQPQQPQQAAGRCPVARQAAVEVMASTLTACSVGAPQSDRQGSQRAETHSTKCLPVPA